MKKINSRKFYIILISFVFTLLSLSAITIVVTTQNQSIDLIASNLQKRNVPVKSLKLVSRIPFEIDIVIQKTAPDKKMSLDDLWNAQLARRETVLASRFGIRLNKFKLIFVDEAGSTVFLEQNFINSDNNLQKSVTTEPKLTKNQTIDLVSQKLNLQGLILDWIDVTYEPSFGDVGQNLILQLSVADLETANKVVPNFLQGLKQLISVINDQSGAEISLCRLRVLDKNQTVLLNFVWDAISKTETSSSIPGLASWYPRPEPTQSQTQKRTLFPTITPSQLYIEKPTNTPQPYPAPTGSLISPTNGPYPAPIQK